MTQQGTPPTRREAEALSFARAFRQRHGYTPTAGEVGRGLGISEDTALRLLVALRRKGHLGRTLEG